MRYGNGWAIGAWFIPIFAMIRPKQIANDIWRGSERGVEVSTQWRLVEVPGLVHWWWGLFLGQGTVVYVGQRLTQAGHHKLTLFGDVGERVLTDQDRDIDRHRRRAARDRRCRGGDHGRLPRNRTPRRAHPRNRRRGPRRFRRAAAPGAASIPPPPPAAPSYPPPVDPQATGYRLRSRPAMYPRSRLHAAAAADRPADPVPRMRGVDPGAGERLPLLRAPPPALRPVAEPHLR